MTKLSVAIGAAAAILLFACAGANAAGFNQSVAPNYTPVVKEAACRGFGPYCGPGFTRVCNRWGRCWCRPCF